MSSPRYWIAVATRDHVKRGVEERFCQACHGKAAPLRRMQPGDWIAYYSSKQEFGEPAPCQAFTAIGRISEGEVFTHQMAEGFTPARRLVTYLPAREASILPLIEKLEFITNKKHWGAPFRFGKLETGREDFQIIAAAMGVDILSAGEE